MVVVVSCVWPTSGIVFATYTFDATDALENVMVLLEAEHGLPQEQQRLVCGSHTWTVQHAQQTFTDVGLVDGGGGADGYRVLVHRLDDDNNNNSSSGGSGDGDVTRAATRAATTMTMPSSPQQLDAAAAQARILELFAQSNSGNTTQQQQQQPATAAAVAAENASVLPPVFDMDDVAVQQRLYEEIQRRNIDESLAQALEHTPEAFASVTMLYIDCAINGVPVKAFVDSGAQVSLMNVATAERCDLMRLLDRRMRGVAKGVGTQTILGRIHLAVVRAGDVHLPCSFAVLEDQTMDVILGLDQLRRHRMCIDLHDNCLRIADKTVPFLGEADLPDHAKLHNNNGEDAEAGGTEAKEQKAVEASAATATAAATAAEGKAEPPRRQQQQHAQPPPQQQQPLSPSLANAQHEEVLQNFMAATAMTDRNAAMALLEAFAWDADAALSAFLSS